MAILLSIISALLYGTADFSGGFATRRNSINSVLVVSQMFGTIIALGAAFVLGGTPNIGDLSWGAVAGIGGAVGIVFLYTGISRSIVAIVSPTSALVGAAVPLVFGVITGEHATPAAWVGVLICLPATILLSTERVPDTDRKRRTALLFGVAAGLGFAVFFIAISRPAAAVGFWPLVAARVTSISLIVIISLIRRTKIDVRAFSAWPVVLAGVLDMGANLAFMAATHFGMLALVAVVTSMYPAPTVILARLVFRERLGAARIAGVGLALAGVALISLG